MSESIVHRINALPDNLTKRELQPLFDAFLAELAVLRTSVTGITAQLDADAGVTDTDYAANNDPAAITITS